MPGFDSFEFVKPRRQFSLPDPRDHQKEVMRLRGTAINHVLRFVKYLDHLTTEVRKTA